MRDVIVALSLLAGIPFCFAWPAVGALLWGWLGFMWPQRITEGLVAGVPFFWLIVVATLAGVARMPSRPPLPRSRELYLLMAFWAFCGFTSLFAVFPERAWARWFELSRILSLLLVVMWLFQGQRKLSVLMWATALPLGIYALGGTVWLMLTGGVTQLYGPRASDIENNNDLAAALIAVLPFFVFLGRSAERRWVRHGSVLLFAVTLIAVLGTYSRAAVLALAVVLIGLAVYRQWRALAVVGVPWVAFLLFTNPQTWIDRVDSIRRFNQDESAASRLPEWYVAMRIGLDHPLVGAGFRPFCPQAYERYVGYSDYHDAHNHFLQVVAEHGFPGLALYTALIASTFVTLWRIAHRPGRDPDAERARDYARMLQIALVAFIVDGMFHCLSYRAIFFDLLVLAMLLDAATRTPAAAAAAPPLRQSAVGG